MIKFDILNRWTLAVQFTAEIDCLEDSPRRIKLGLAVKWAIKNAADLTRANLTAANLTDANLTAANFTDANLTDADLTAANLTDADLTRANLTDANLTRADLTRANFTDANLTDANLTDADLTAANLTAANFTDARTDFISEVIKLPHELEFLRDALIAGKVDGSTYSGECACLAGTLAHARGIPNYNGEPIKNGLEFFASSNSPRERFFLAIRKGDTPDKNPCCKIALEWTNEAIAIRDNILSHASK